jgi:hypothetical protein
MSTTTVLHEYEQWLKDRHERGEITTSTLNTYLNEASRIFEVLLRHLPPNVIEGYMETEGYQGYYGHVISALRLMARSRGRVAFKNPDDAQPRLPGV